MISIVCYDKKLLRFNSLWYLKIEAPIVYGRKEKRKKSFGCFNSFRRRDFLPDIREFSLKMTANAGKRRKKEKDREKRKRRKKARKG